MRNHLHETLAIDFAVVLTVTFGIVYVFFVLSLERRRVLHLNVTRHPTAARTAQQVVTRWGLIGPYSLSTHHRQLPLRIRSAWWLPDLRQRQDLRGLLSE
jgi:hypothetical protein